MQDSHGITETPALHPLSPHTKRQVGNIHAGSHWHTCNCSFFKAIISQLNYGEMHLRILVPIIAWVNHYVSSSKISAAFCSPSLGHPHIAPGVTPANHCWGSRPMRQCWLFPVPAVPLVDVNRSHHLLPSHTCRGVSCRCRGLPLYAVQEGFCSPGGGSWRRTQDKGVSKL